MTTKLAVVTQKQSKPRASRARKPAQIPFIQRALTPTISVLIPLGSVGFTALAGSLWRAEVIWLALAATGVCLCIFGVSINHAAQTFRAITRMPPKSAWTLAAAIDVAVIVTELAQTFAPDVVGGTLCILILVAVGCLSAALNFTAFRNHQTVR